ncbi:alpha/beta fold hydrolase [Marinoscillum furvescens]|uniref:Pimeloyl-ACP methyl ester carboxylesterase n=1 Tax=Marinoscillum furvescens DSM 4134 TaxID=1122208 RepID=A0A3D9L6C8_MARFU|nr:alpha/beta fold hydrolase [Marinoscillum furvescens]REE01674.1 pimeloyl-ACP methyl ester carboxylesterase [Marinoscillum furvescens DSM 4134]
MKLNFRKYGTGHPLFVLHGVFGSSDNWQTHGKALAEHFTVYLIDQRNHGNSPHSEEMTYEAMAEDLKKLMDDEGLSSIYVLGHSMGGKTAMTFATSYPEAVDKLIVVDIAPKYYPPHHSQIFEGFHSVQLDSIGSRKEADEQLSKVIKEAGVRMFILKNLSRDESNNFVWKLNLPVIESNIQKIGEGLVDGASFSGPTLFIGGGASDYIQESDHDLIKDHFPDATIKMVPGAGHWVHAEKPKELGELVMDFLA